VDGLPHDALALAALVFVLGLKHGLDPDHLVAIDGLTRFNNQGDRRLARWCGALFSLGHGAVVILVAVAVGLATERWIVPAWLDDLGAWISVTVLVLLGLLNLRAVVATPAEHVVRPVGLRGRLFDRLTRTSHPGAIALVGALFALSFDTLSQAALFAVTASQLGGWLPALALGLVFMVGMTLADGANGLWIASLLRSADARARIASRVLGLAVAGLSLGIAAFVVVERHSSAVAAWADGRELVFGGGVIAVVATASLLGLMLARRPTVATSATPRT
jgi:high-affinity nickel-transport protein